MSAWRAALLALVQGVTEFLPISSSAHLILVPHLTGWRDQGLAFDIATHAGSLVAILVYFRRELAALVRAVPRALTRRAVVPGSDPFMLWVLAIGTVPVVVAGYLLQDWVAGEARNPLLIAATSIVFGLLLGWADWKGRETRRVEDVGWRDAVVVGLAQAVALVPGTSRAGITITAGRFLGLTRPDAARFSFLLAIPVGLIVSGKDALDLAGGGVAAVDWSAIAIGFLVSAVSAYAVVAWLLAWLQRQSLQAFVVYRVALGLFLFWWFG